MLWAAIAYAVRLIRSTQHSFQAAVTLFADDKAAMNAWKEVFEELWPSDPYRESARELELFEPAHRMVADQPDLRHILNAEVKRHGTDRLNDMSAVAVEQIFLHTVHLGTL